ncbi:MAG: PLDc N-terminal domain-containing protein [Gammaproteobacteria bacterium]
MTSLLALVVLILDIWAIIQIIGSAEPVMPKLLWTLLILFLPLIGLIIWWFLGPRSGRVRTT